MAHSTGLFWLQYSTQLVPVQWHPLHWLESTSLEAGKEQHDTVGLREQ